MNTKIGLSFLVGVVVAAVAWYAAVPPALFWSLWFSALGTGALAAVVWWK